VFGLVMVSVSIKECSRVRQFSSVQFGGCERSGSVVGLGLGIGLGSVRLALRLKIRY